jgi:hypothetical protein
MLEQLYLTGPMVPNLEALRGWGLRRYAREFVYPLTQHAVSVRTRPSYQNQCMGNLFRSGDDNLGVQIDVAW